MRSAIKFDPKSCFAAYPLAAEMLNALMRIDERDGTTILESNFAQSDSKRYF